MPPLTDPTCITVIGTCAFLTVAAIVVTIKAAADLRKFRENIKPGDYANVLVDDDYFRCKFISYNAPFYLFRTVHSKEKVIVIKSKIYQP